MSVLNCSSVSCRWKLFWLTEKPNNQGFLDCSQCAVGEDVGRVDHTTNHTELPKQRLSATNLGRSIVSQVRGVVMRVLLLVFITHIDVCWPLSYIVQPHRSSIFNIGINQGQGIGLCWLPNMIEKITVQCWSRFSLLLLLSQGDFWRLEIEPKLLSVNLGVYYV